MGVGASIGTRPPTPALPHGVGREKISAWATLFLLVICQFASPALAADKPDATPHNRLSAEQVSAGWINLFDGQTMFGWKPNNNINWQITDGVVHADQGDPGLLVTTAEFSDYELLCDFRLEKGGNSGIFLRTLFVAKDPTTDCYELNMCDTHPAFPTGSLVGLIKPDKPIAGEEKWMTYHVVVQGNQIDVKLDGKPILSYTDKRPAARKRGFIGLQKNAGKAEYRNVYLRPLSTAPLFNGKDLAGWRVVPGGTSKFTVVDDTIHCVNGRGFLETESTWGDFVLQAQIKTNGKNLNSGIFFRAMPGTEKAPSNGYEAQVHSGYQQDDRTKPADYGTGGIYNRVKARRVVSNDFEWFTMTVVATGAHVGIWVDGEQVTDWTDPRPPNDNPREGLRTKAGHLSLQGHDPTTDLSFRNLRAAELPPGE
jgi:3-keto-disaccharide hydrolase